MPRGTRTTYERAICGLVIRDGDYVTLSNQWASVTITYHEDDRAWFCTGDLLETREESQSFLSARDAYNYAIGSLAEFAKGRLS